MQNIEWKILIFDPKKKRKLKYKKMKSVLAGKVN